MRGQDSLYSIHPLPSRAIPLPGEDLASLISRSAHMMGYKNVLWLLEPEEIDYHIAHEVCTLRKVMSYQVLERLLQLSKEKLYEMTFHHFAAYLYEAGNNSLQGGAEGILRPILSKSTLQRFFISQAGGTRVCPLCLVEGESYGRLYWNILPIIICPRHSVLLVDRCPVCNKMIPVLRSSLTRCPRCQKGDYRQAPTISLLGDYLLNASQTIILNHLDIDRSKMLRVKEHAESPLVNLTSWQYFRLLDAFRYILTPLFPDNPFLQARPDRRMTLQRRVPNKGGLSLSEWLVFLATFHYTFESWPDNFFTLLNTLSLVERLRTGVRGHFGTLSERWLYSYLKHEDFAFLREAFGNYLRRWYTGGVIDPRFSAFQGDEGKALWQGRHYVTKTEAREMLGAYGKRTNVQCLIDSGILHAVKVPLGTTGKKDVSLLEKVEVEAFLKEKKDLLLREAFLKEKKDLLLRETVRQSFLGTGPKVMLALARSGLLMPTHDLTIGLHKPWLYKQADVAQFIAIVLNCTQKNMPSSMDIMPLLKALCPTTLTLVEIITKSLAGSIKLFDMETSPLLFHRLAVSREDLHPFLKRKHKSDN